MPEVTRVISLFITIKSFRTESVFFGKHTKYFFMPPSTVRLLEERRKLYDVEDALQKERQKASKQETELRYVVCLRFTFQTERR